MDDGCHATVLPGARRCGRGKLRARLLRISYSFSSQEINQSTGATCHLLQHTSKQRSVSFKPNRGYHKGGCQKGVIRRKDSDGIFTECLSIGSVLILRMDCPKLATALRSKPFTHSSLRGVGGAWNGLEWMFSLLLKAREFCSCRDLGFLKRERCVDKALLLRYITREQADKLLPQAEASLRELTPPNQVLATK